MTSAGTQRGPRRWGAVRALRRSPLLLDVVAAAVLAVVTVTVRHPDAAPGHSAPPAALVLAGLACLALAGRRSRPRVVLAVTVAATLAARVLAGAEPVFSFAVPVALYTVAVARGRRSTVTAFVVATAVLVGTVIVVGTAIGASGRSLLDAASGLTTANLVAAAVGDAVRSRRAYVAAVEDRALRAEQTREEEARRRVVEERLRIARELHDVVAHHVAVVSVQAGVADHLVLTAPAAAQQAMRHVQHASAAILEELSGILGVLRQPDEGDPAGPPAPGLDQLHALVDSYVAAGLRVRLSTAGSPRPLGGAVELVAYRVAQEALTNAHKHGTGRAELGLTYAPDAVVVEVTNPVAVPGGGPHGTGHGLLGMRERATAVGGDLEVGERADGTFRVRLTLPAPAPAPVPDPDPAGDPAAAPAAAAV